MASNHTPRIKHIKKEYTRAEILESLAYELKPFVLAAAGFAGGVYFMQHGSVFGKYFSIVLMGCGLAILYWRAKDRGVLQKD